MIRQISLPVLFAALLIVGLRGQPEAKTPIELGSIAWERDFAKASRRSERQSKPLLLLFQEVPG